MEKRLTSPRELGRRCTERSTLSAGGGGWCRFAGRGQQSFHLQGGTWNPLKTWCACLLLPLLTTRWGGDPTNTVCASQIRSRAKLSSSSNYKPNAGASNQRQRARFLLGSSYLILAKNMLWWEKWPHAWKFEHRPPTMAINGRRFERNAEMNENRGCALKIKGKNDSRCVLGARRVRDSRRRLAD